MESDPKSIQPGPEHAVPPGPHDAAPASPAPPPVASVALPPSHPWRKWLLLAVIVAGLAAGGYFLVPLIVTMLNTVSTDDAYVNGHVTFVAPRVAGQVSRGAGGRQLPREKGRLAGPARQGAVPGSGRRSRKPPWRRPRRTWWPPRPRCAGWWPRRAANRFKLEHAIEDVNTQIANLRANVATSRASRRRLELAKANLKRGEELAAERRHQQGRPRPAPADGQGRRGGRRASPAGGLRDPGRPRPSRRSRPRART